MESAVNKPTARLEGWRVITSSEGTKILRGTVFGHPNMPDLAYVTTTEVVAMNSDGTEAETKNTIYKLGKQDYGDVASGAINRDSTGMGYVMSIAPEFTSYKLNVEGFQKARLISEEFTKLIQWLQYETLESREWSLAKTKLEEACFYAKKAMAKNPLYQEREN